MRKWIRILRKQVGQGSQVLEPADCDRTLCETEINTLLTAAKKDEEDLKDLLWDSACNHVCSVSGCGRESTCMQYLAKQLLGKLKFQSQYQAWDARQKKNYHEGLYKSTVDNLSAWPSVVSVNIHSLKARTLLGEGAYGIVLEAEWLKEPYAMKISRYGHQEVFKHEIAALSGRVRNGKRPQLPPNCPDYLSSLIEECWGGKPVNRPDFQTICRELRYIKGCLLTGLDNNLSLQSATARFPAYWIGGSIEGICDHNMGNPHPITS
ncbi:unnamed protein product [Sphagnum tenellum]